jgi:hypothetical protein
MANNVIYFENPHTGQMKEAPVGFSWTVALFGPFPMLFRGSWKWFAIQLILCLISGGLSSLVFMFIANRLYIRDLVDEGFKARTVKTGTLDDISRTLGFAVPALDAKSA